MVFAINMSAKNVMTMAMSLRCLDVLNAVMSDGTAGGLKNDD